MTYPVEILPSSNKKELECNLNNCLLFRYYTPNFELDKLSLEDSYINQKYIAHPSSNISDLSTNLFGVFNLENGKIQIIGNATQYYYQYCKVNDSVKIPRHKKDFLIVDNRSFWFVKIENIENGIAVYNNPNPNSTSFTAKCKVIHSPMRWNYWHFSIRWKIEPKNKPSFWLDQIPQKSQKKYSKKINFESRSILAKHIQMNIHINYTVLDVADYSL